MVATMSPLHGALLGMGSGKQDRASGLSGPPSPCTPTLPGVRKQPVVAWSPDTPAEGFSTATNPCFEHREEEEVDEGARAEAFVRVGGSPSSLPSCVLECQLVSLPPRWLPPVPTPWSQGMSAWLFAVWH